MSRWKDEEKARDDESVNYEGRYQDPNEQYFDNGEVKVKWEKVFISKADNGKLYVCGETQLQAEAARDVYEYLDRVSAKPEPMPKNITKEALDKFFREENGLNK